MKVIANNGGLYSAQIGVVGVITKQRQKRRYGQRSYDVAYRNARGAERIVIVREDDLEPVEALNAPVETAQAVTAPPAPAEPSETIRRDQREHAQVTALLAMAPHDAAHWLACWLIRTDVTRGYSEADISNGHEGRATALGNVHVDFGGKIVVRRIGPLASWVERYGYSAAGYDYHETFSLHRIYEAVQAELRTPAQQMSLWGSEVAP